MFEFCVCFVLCVCVCEGVLCFQVYLRSSLLVFVFCVGVCVVFCSRSLCRCLSRCSSVGV